jgi:hypothetical protein
VWMARLANEAKKKKKNSEKGTHPIIVQVCWKTAP